MSMKYHSGCLFEYVDNLLSSTDDKIAIPHVVNNINKMGSGFVVPLYTRWPKVKSEYHRLCNTYKTESNKYLLGLIQEIEISDRVSVINMFAQNGVIGKDNPKPIRYNALATCLESVNIDIPKSTKIVAPKFGAGLAGGDWDAIEQMIQDSWRNLDVTICYK